MGMTEQYKKWASLNISDIKPMDVSEMELARMKKKVVNSKRGKAKKLKWLNVVVASLFISGIILTASTTGIAQNIKGYFQDITNWNDAVVNTQYTLGVDDIDVEVGNIVTMEGKFVVPLTVTLNNHKEEPFASMEAIGLREALLLDQSNNEISKFEIQEEPGLSNNLPFEVKEQDHLFNETIITNETRVFHINLLVNEEAITKKHPYTLKLQSLYMYKAADAPLKVNGALQVDLMFE